MATTYYELQDLITATLYAEQKGKITNLDPDLLRSYPAAMRLVKKKQVKLQGGIDIRWRVNVSPNSSATHFASWHTVTRSAVDSLKTCSMQMRNTRADYSFDALEPEFNQGEYALVDLVKSREQDAKISLTKQIEADFWSNAASTDEVTPQGILYFLPYTSTVATDTNKGFTGTAPSGYTTVAGLNPSTYTGWKSQGDVWTAATDADLFLKLRFALSRTGFKSPLSTMLVSDFNTGNDYAIYANLQTTQEFENAAKAQNDSIGTDLNFYYGKTLFRRILIEEVPYLEDNTRDPVIGINWGQVKNFVLSNWWMRTEKVGQNPDQPLTVSFDMYCVNQMCMMDRRTGGFNIAKAA